MRAYENAIASASGPNNSAAKVRSPIDRTVPQLEQLDGDADLPEHGPAGIEEVILRREHEPGPVEAGDVLIRAFDEEERVIEDAIGARAAGGVRHERIERVEEVEREHEPERALVPEPDAEGVLAALVEVAVLGERVAGDDEPRARIWDEREREPVEQRIEPVREAGPHLRE